jgi:hypothetical protein
MMATAALVIALQPVVHASDPVGVFGLIDKVVFEPNDSAPERVQIWGAFALANARDRDAYNSPEQGYLYFTLPKEKSEVARKEWNDLKKVAGKHEIIGFGSRYQMSATVRKKDAKPAEPDPYVVGVGLVKMSERGPDYAPIKGLKELSAAKRTDGPANK